VPFATQFFAAAPYQLSGALYVSDYRATCRAPPACAPPSGGPIWGFTGSGWTMLVGAFAAASHPGAEVASAVEAAGDTIRPRLRPADAAGLAARPAHHEQPQLLRRFAALLSAVDSLRPIRLPPAKRVASLA
jgi:purine-cytosine permease-like protein